MKLRDLLSKFETTKDDAKFFYKAFVNEKPVEIEIIQITTKGKSEIIRLSQIKERTHYAGFWVNTEDIWIKSKTTFRQIKDI